MRTYSGHAPSRTPSPSSRPIDLELKLALRSYHESCRRSEELYKARVMQILAKAQEKGGASA